MLEKQPKSDAPNDTGYQSLLLKLANTFVSLPPHLADVAINDALKQTGEFFSVDRAYVFAYDHTRGVTSNTHEWCAPGISPQMDNLQDIPLAEIPEWVDQHRAGQSLLIPRVSQLPPGHLKDVLSSQDIQSLSAFPLMIAGECTGFVGFDAVRAPRAFGQREIELLGLFARLLANLKIRRESEQRASHNANLLQSVLESPQGMVIFALDREYRYLAFTDAHRETMRQIWGETITVGRSILLTIKADEDRIRAQHNFDRAFRGEYLVTEELYGDERFSRRCYENRYSPLLGEDGSIVGVTVFVTDISERKQAEDKLRLAASVFEHAGEGIIITDENAVIIDVNETFTRITGFSREDAIGKTPKILSSGRHDRAFYARMWQQLTETGSWQGEIWNRNKRGETFPESLTIAAVPGTEGRGRRYVALFSDITELKSHERRLQHLAHFDPLTGLPNRVLLADRLQQAMTHCRLKETLLAVAFLDLDGFKAINDSHGHATGDDLLVTISTRMSECLGEADTLARLGGDEFVAVLLDLQSPADCEPILKKLLAEAARPVELHGASYRVSTSIGVTFFPQASVSDAEHLLRQADQAMYQAKIAGKNRYHIFDTEHDRHARDRHATIERIREGLHAGEFELFFQPKVNMRTGMFMGAEALIRWRHPERGLLTPYLFLPILENHSLMDELSDWVMSAAFSHVARWLSEGIAVPVSINVAPSELETPGLADRIRKYLAIYPQVSPALIQLEILESSAMQDIAQVSGTLGELSRMGIALALDDFGAGYASLSYLKRLPTETIKIDMSFVRNMLDDPEDLSILVGVRDLASAFRRQLVAEGVETEEHGVALLQLGCELGQGYGISRPMPAAELQHWLQTWKPSARWQQQRPLPREKTNLLFAAAEHRAWALGVERSLDSSQLPPTLREEECRFGRWLVSGEARQLIEPAQYQRLAALHSEVHQSAEQLVFSARENPGVVDPSLLEHFRRSRDLLISAFQASW
ncbi:MAG: EAL domain-containing protein [Spirochaetota bacterium]